MSSPIINIIASARIAIMAAIIGVANVIDIYTKTEIHTAIIARDSSPPAIFSTLLYGWFVAERN
jgi:predicted permease